MTLSAGTRFGRYEVLAPLGAGGMGEVYRARDARLNRDVAIKVLPTVFAGDSDRLARFEREAQMLAALNHSHIATIYGIEDAGDVCGLAMELVEGPTLAERLASGPIGLPETLAIARDIAEALEYAHERSIIHRDLKPANLKITPDGTVKILDFGLAKALSNPPANTNLANSPTISVAATQAGVLLGTAAYMAPEQARGQTVDRRVDIWAFGCVLYEMLVGRQPFPGATLTDVLAAIVSREPDWDALPADTPPRLVALIRRCLRKDSRDRLRDIGDARVEIEELQQAPLHSVAAVKAPATQSTARSWSLPATAGLLIGGLAVAAASSLWPVAPTSSPVSTHLVAPLPEKTGIDLGRGSAVALSPDGRTVIFVGNSGGLSWLFVRPLDRADSNPLTGTEGATNPFFSPDGKWVGFFAGGKLKKVSLSGGQPVTICDAPGSRGEAWAPDDTIFFTPQSGSALWRVPAGGGKPEEATKREAGELSHRWPQVLPGGKAVLFTVWNDTGYDGARIVAHSLVTGRRQVIAERGGYARFVAAEPGSNVGYLIYARTSGLLAAPFDAEGLQITGPTVPILDGVVTNLSGGAHFSVSNGSLAYVAGGMVEGERTVLQVDRTGTARPLATIRGMSLFFSLSPDGKRLARSNPTGPKRDIWIHDLERGTAMPLTHRDNSSFPIWTGDGKRVAFSSGLPDSNIFWKAADGSGTDEQLTVSRHTQFANSFSPDGKVLAFVEYSGSGSDIWIQPLEGDRTPRPFTQTPFTETEASFSPDGKWLAYHSNESGRFEIYVQAYPAGGRKYQVSTDGGRWAQWARNGREIFYRTQNRMMTAAVGVERVSGTSDMELQIGKPRLLFEGSYEDIYSVTPGGDFVLIRIDSSENAPTRIEVVLDWIEELKRRVK
jgi:serine/threonine protein kinase